jgi:hypothetical protein
MREWEVGAEANGVLVARYATVAKLFGEPKLPAKLQRALTAEGDTL